MKPKKSGTSSSLPFRPMGAIKNDPWQSQATPASAIEQKAVIITAGTVPDNNLVDLLTFTSWLHLNEFRVYLCHTTSNQLKGKINVFTRYRGQADNQSLLTLSHFNKEVDYLTLDREKGIPQDYLVVLNIERYYKIKIFMAQHKQPTDKAHIVKTPTTLRIHYRYPILTVGHLAYSLRILPEQAATLFKRHESNMLRGNPDELLLCLNAYPQRKKTIMQQLGEKQNKHDLEIWLKMASKEAKTLIIKHGHVILTGYQLAFLLKVAPKESKILLEKYENLIINGEQLAQCIEAAPQEAKMLLKNHENLIINGEQLAQCIEAAPQEAKMLLEKHEDLITDGEQLAQCVKAAPQKAKMLLEKYEDLITDGEQLAQCVKAAPQEAKMLLEKHGDLITNGKQLAQCVKAAPQETKILFKKHEDLITNAGGLIKCIMAMPYQSKMLLEKHMNLITTFRHLEIGLIASHYIPAPNKRARILLKQFDYLIANDEELIECLGAVAVASNEAKYLLTKYENSITNGMLLAAFIKAIPGKAKILLKKYGDLITDSKELSSCIWAAPEEGKMLLMQYADKMANEPDFHKVISAVLRNIPEIEARQVIRKYRTTLTRADVLDSYLFHARKETELLIEMSEIDRCEYTRGTLKRILNKMTHQHTLEMFIQKYAHLLGYLKIGKLMERVSYRSISAPRMLLERHFLEHGPVDELWERVTLHLHAFQPLPHYTKIVNLYLGIINQDTLDDIQDVLKQVDSLKHIAVIDVAHCADENIKFLDAILSTLHKTIGLKHKLVSLPIRLQNHYRPSFPCLLSYVNYRQVKFTHQEENARPVRNSHVLSYKSSALVCVANNGLGNEFPVTLSKDRSNFSMIACGKWLNSDGRPPQRIRTGIVNLDEKNHMALTFYHPKEFTLLKNISRSAKNSSCNIPKEAKKTVFYQFDCKVGTQWTRLLSVDAHESLFDTQYDQDLSLQFARGSDGFLYAKGKRSGLLRYVVKAVHKNVRAEQYANIHNSDPIKSIIEDFKNPLKGYEAVTNDHAKLPIMNNSDYRAWLLELFSLRTGTCMQRSAAVIQKIICKNDKLKSKVRLVRIDNNHIQIEIEHKKNEWLCVDLGGSEVRLSYNNTPTFYQAVDSSPYSSSVRLGKSESKESQNTDLKTLWEDEQDTTGMITIEAEDLAELLTNKIKKILLRSPEQKHIESSANRILQEARAKGIRTFYLHTYDQIDFGVEQILLDEKSRPFITTKGLLEQFLQKSAQSKRPALLLINWTKLSAKHRTQLYNLFKKKGSIAGAEIPSVIKVIGLCDRTIKDRSFIYRHDLIGCMPTVRPNLYRTSNYISTKKQTTDLKGYSRWKEKLFGPILQHGEHLIWKKSEFVLSLQEEKGNSIEIINASQVQALTVIINRAQVRGYFLYHGYKIILPAGIEITCRDVAFDFSRFSAIAVHKQTQLNEIPAHIYITNTHVLDNMLSDKIIVNGQYKDTPGAIEQASNQSLTVLISSELTSAQWYCLLSEAEEDRVALKLYLMSGISTPNKLKIDVLKKPVGESEKSDENHRRTLLPAYRSNNVKKDLKSILAKDKQALVFYVEDYSCQDFLYHISFQKKAHGFTNFKVVISDVLQALVSGKSVVLCGEFTKTLLCELLPLLLHKSIRIPTDETLAIKGKLTLLVEARKSPYPWVQEKPPQNIEQQHSEAKHRSDTSSVSLNPRSNILYKEPSSHLDKEYEISPEAEEIALAFIQKRKTAVLQAIFANRMIQLVGETGTGKSSLMQLIAQEDRDSCRIYHEFLAFEKWATNKSDKTKILFIDEANIEDLQLTLFKPVQTASLNPTLLYKGKIYTLDENHRVVFSLNPKNYGGGRVKQKLLSDGSVPSIYLSDFPPDYIYAIILKTIYKMTHYQGSNRDNFEIFCAKLINQYLQIRSKNDPREFLTVRELQESALNYCIPLTKGEISVSTSQASFFKNKPFITTTENRPIVNALEKFIHLRKTLHALNKKNILNGMGLNAVLIEGRPGTGKSLAIQYALSRSGYHIIRDPSKNLDSKKAHICYEIDASMPPSRKKALIIRAFNEGNAIWIDELNSCIDEDSERVGLEKTLNAVLTGVHPGTKKEANKSGFMAFFTANSGLKGRRILSPAIRHRCRQLKTLPFQLAGIQRILKDEFPALNKSSIEEIAKNFISQQKGGVDLRCFITMQKIRSADFIRSEYAQSL